MRFRISRRADADLNRIWDYIARNDPAAADRVEREFHQTFQSLAAMPGQGHVRPDVADASFRFWSVFSYLIVYRKKGREIIIVRVVHGARDLTKLFKRRGRP